MFGFLGFARANKENILYTILTIFLLERVRRGWNRIEKRGRSQRLRGDDVSRTQQTFLFRAAVLYALPFVLPMVKYIYRSLEDLSRFVPGLAAMSSLWILALVALLCTLFLSVVIYNLLGIYIERMNAAFGFFRRIGRSVADGSRVAVSAGYDAGREVVVGVRDAARDTVRSARLVATLSARSARAAVSGTALRLGLRRAAG